MADRRLLAIITLALMMPPETAANAAFSLAELQRIEGLVSSRDCGGLWLYLRNNPSLTVGNDPLAVELRNFTNGINDGLIDCLSTPGRSGRAPDTQVLGVEATY